MAFRKRRRSELKKLEEFARAHAGVEAYVEPRTGIREQSLLLVARDGTWVRELLHRRVEAELLCKDLQIPLYDAAVVGYPERMRGRPRKDERLPSPEELKAWFANEGGPNE